MFVCLLSINLLYMCPLSINLLIIVCVLSTNLPIVNYSTLHKKVCKMIVSHCNSFAKESYANEYAKLYKLNNLNKLWLIT